MVARSLPKTRGGVGELGAGDLHAVAGIAGETDGHGIHVDVGFFVRIDRDVGYVRRHREAGLQGTRGWPNRRVKIAIYPSIIPFGGTGVGKFVASAFICLERPFPASNFPASTPNKGRTVAKTIC